MVFELRIFFFLDYSRGEVRVGKGCNVESVSWQVAKKLKSEIKGKEQTVSAAYRFR